jgi:competence protein ComEC
MQFYQQLRFYPFVRILIPFVSGIIFGFYCHPDIYVTGSVIAGLSFAAVLIHKKNRSYRLRWLYGIVVNMLLLVAGLLILNLHDAENEKTRQFSGKRMVFEAIVADEMSETKNSVKSILKVRYIHHGTNNPANFKVMAYFKKDNRSGELRTGDILMVHSVLNEIEEPKNPYEFNYKRWMQHRGTVLTTYLSGNSWKVIGRKNGFASFISGLRHQVVQVYEKSGISNDELAVLSALTLGSRESLPEKVEKSFAMAGAMHVLAVSGLHVGIIFMVLNTLLFFMQRFKYGKFIRWIMMILFLWFFAFLTGMRPSVVRAVFMFSTIQTGQSLKKPPEIYNTISLSAFCLLLINPYQLTDVGFQLSYLAITGIVFFQPKIYRLLYVKNKIIDKIWQLFTVSIAAQLVTAPLTTFYFHYFPLYFWLTNLFVIVLTGLIIYLAVFQISIYALHLPYLFTGKILNLALKLLNGLTFKIHSLPHSLIENINTSLFEMLLFYCMIISMTVFLMKRYRKALIWSFIFLLAIIIEITTVSFIFETQNRLVVFSVRNHSVIGLVRGREILFLSDMPDALSLSKSFQVKNYLIKRGIKRSIRAGKMSELPYADIGSVFCIEQAGTNIFFKSGHLRGLLLNDLDVFGQRSGKKLGLDCIILSHNVNAGPEQLTNLFRFRHIILDSSNSYRYRLSWLNSSKSDEYKIYSIADSKAFEINSGL